MTTFFVTVGIVCCIVIGFTCIVSLAAVAYLVFQFYRICKAEWDEEERRRGVL